MNGEIFQIPENTLPKIDPTGEETAALLKRDIVAEVGVEASEGSGQESELAGLLSGTVLQEELAKEEA